MNDAPGDALRLIPYGAAPPAFNMAADEVLLRGAITYGRPTLRFYGWNPPGLSLGRFQRKMDGINVKSCRSRGITPVRRLTGGRAVLHHREITYSLASPYRGPFRGLGLRETYHLISAGIAAGLDRLGAHVDLADGQPAAMATANCFSSASRMELTWRGRKMVGSAQYREKEGFLQHGAILLDIDDEYWTAVFADGRAMTERAVGLRQVLGRFVSPAEVESSLAVSLAERLAMEIAVGPLTEAEKAAAERLTRKYVNIEK